MKEDKKWVNETIEKNKQKYIDCLLKLASIDTHDIGHGIEGGLEGAGQEYLVQLFNEMQADSVEKDPLKEESILKCKELYREGNTGHNYENRFNVYATLNGKSEKSILFNGHIDHMPADNLKAWDIPPLEPQVIDDRITGLGIADMKAGLMACIMASMVFRDAGKEFPITVKYATVCDEEGGGNGSLCAAMSGVKADAVVVCEPTNYELIAAHMGWVFFEVEVEGIAVHSGLKLAGVNAIEKAYLLMQAIDDLEHRWLLKYKHQLLPPPSSNVGVICGGEAGSTIPDYCSFKTCVHYLPGVMSHEQVVQEYTDAILKRCEGDEWLSQHKPKISIYQTGNPFEMDLSHPFVSAFQNAYENAMERPVKIVGSPAGCDSRTWHNIVKCPTLQYGPGSLEQCHTVNEYVTVDQYLDAIKIYVNLILEWAEK
ncbi:M20 family metallopeptidase [Hespellia stercorisuis]|uniref:Acetylornithine deacetylase n=1 Tax=Hespellia stercorisuis DSM 15480 TaxID=1121950 RepID=A0A1M6QKJ7_9FIRM|nr:ArgE/DapE family deacylase [Hespellia stercorisuis]SHK20573.1 acetylornithine deacetylase [Hespellia stercorisuis DSM 15480]